MATQYSVGHGMRRRNGTPSNPLETAGPAMARSHKTSDEHHADAAMAGSHRIAIGQGSPDMSAYGQMDEINPAQMRGTLMPRNNVQAGDPTNPGSKQNRQNIEVIGASYRVAPKAMFVQLDPAAGPTMANARIIPSVSGRSNPNFQGGNEASYL